MKVRILLGDDGGASMSIKLAGCGRVEMFSSDGSLTIVEADGPGNPAARVEAASSKRRGRRRIGRLGGADEGSPVSSEMEAAAVRAFLAGADNARLGRALSAVYRAMDAVRRGRDPSDDDGDDR